MKSNDRVHIPAILVRAYSKAVIGPIIDEIQK
jgi:hypothetical protein